MNPPPVFTRRGCLLVSDQSSILFGSTTTSAPHGGSPSLTGMSDFDQTREQYWADR
jgi:hypothetical protein